jgi:hypothetical protein
MPSNKRDAITGRDLDFLDAIQTGLRWRDAGRIGKIHVHAVAEIGRHANYGIDRDEPRNEFHDFPLEAHPHRPTRSDRTTAARTWSVTRIVMRRGCQQAA